MLPTSIQMLIFASAAATVSGYPMVSSSKRYGAWLPFRAHPPPPTYVETFSAPAAQDELVDFYYPPAESPVYYQLPYYYSVPSEYYYETSNDDIEDEPQQWYVGSNAETNAIFLRNLMLAQLYSRSMPKDDNIGDERIWPKSKSDEDDFINDDDSETYVYGEPMKAVNQLSKEDRDVRELKSLVENRWVDKREDEKKVMARNQVRQEYQPTAYDAIKKLLIQQEKKDNVSRQPHKRSYTPNEDSLVEQLGNLKKI